MSKRGFPNSRANKAYRLVALDVLSCLEEQGLVERDPSGWYLRVNAMAELA